MTDDGLICGGDVNRHQGEEEGGGVGGRDEEEEKEVLMGLMVGTTYGFFRLNDETDTLEWLDHFTETRLDS